MTDITDTLAPNSDQLDAVELVGGPRTFQVDHVVVRKGDEQPVNIHLVGFPRPWRPGKSMRRVLGACWGTDSAAWAGRWVTLFCDPDVTFGKDRVGGTRISHLSHIDGPRDVMLLVSRGKSKPHHVEPLTDIPAPTPSRDWAAEAAALTSEAEARALWKEAPESERHHIEARVAEIKGAGDDVA